MKSILFTVQRGEPRTARLKEYINWSIPRCRWKVVELDAQLSFDELSKLNEVNNHDYDLRYDIRINESRSLKTPSNYILIPDLDSATILACRFLHHKHIVYSPASIQKGALSHTIIVVYQQTQSIKDDEMLISRDFCSIIRRKVSKNIQKSLYKIDNITSYDYPETKKIGKLYTLPYAPIMFASYGQE